uniref:Uncharacterized protein n=1 Tax=Parascaris univalens TaxID=6257 RepID=A0A915C5V8_PARUN
MNKTRGNIWKNYEDNNLKSSTADSHCIIS